MKTSTDYKAAMARLRVIIEGEHDEIVLEQLRLAQSQIAIAMAEQLTHEIQQVRVQS